MSVIMKICLELLSEWWSPEKFGISCLRSYHNYCDSHRISWKFSPSNSAAEASRTENFSQPSHTSIPLRYGSDQLIDFRISSLSLRSIWSRPCYCSRHLSSFPNLKFWRLSFPTICCPWLTLAWWSISRKYQIL